MTDDAPGPNPPSNSPEERAEEILRAVVRVAAELALDLDATWDYFRDIVADATFEAAKERYGSAAQTAAALATSMRTVQEHRRKHREGSNSPRFNMRRRVLHILDEGPSDLASIEGRLPAGSDVNYARAALRTLVSDDLVVFDERIKRYRRATFDYEPWYRQSETFRGRGLGLFFRHLATHVGSRFTPLRERGTEPASMCGLALNIPEDAIVQFARDVYEALSEVEAKWKDQRGSDPAAPVVLVGCEAAFGRLGPGLSEGDLSSLRSDVDGPLWGTMSWRRRVPEP